MKKYLLFLLLVVISGCKQKNEAPKESDHNSPTAAIMQPSTATIPQNAVAVVNGTAITRDQLAFKFILPSTTQNPKLRT